jgi:tetratricopeptide (TPR) repeat protein
MRGMNGDAAKPGRRPPRRALRVHARSWVFVSMLLVGVGAVGCGEVERPRAEAWELPAPTVRSDTPSRAVPRAEAALPEEAAAHRRQALAALDANDAAAALQDLERAAGIAGWTYALRVDEAIAHALAGDAERSRAATEKAIALAAPGSAPIEALAAQIEALLWAGRRVEALQAAERLADAHPERIEGHFVRGKALLEMARGPEAVEAFRDALARAPGDLAATLGLAAALSFTLQHDEAFSLLDGLAETTPDAPWVAYQLGIASQAASLADDAIAWHQKALELGGPAAIPDAHLQLAVLLLARDDARGARPHLELFLRHAPPSAAPERRFATQQLERTKP